MSAVDISGITQLLCRIDYTYCKTNICISPFDDGSVIRKSNTFAKYEVSSNYRQENQNGAMEVPCGVDCTAHLSEIIDLRFWLPCDIVLSTAFVPISIRHDSINQASGNRIDDESQLYGSLSACGAWG